MCEKLRCFISTTSGRPWADSEGTPAPHFTFMLHFYPPHQAVGCSLKTKKKLLHSLEMDPVWFFSIRHVADFFYFWSAAVIYEPWIHLPPASQKKKKDWFPLHCRVLTARMSMRHLKRGFGFLKATTRPGSLRRYRSRQMSLRLHSSAARYRPSYMSSSSSVFCPSCCRSRTLFAPLKISPSLWKLV